MGKNNSERARIAYTALKNIRATFNDDSNHVQPMPLDKIGEELSELKISKGDTILVNSSASNLYYGTDAVRRPNFQELCAYSKDIIEILIRLVGPTGTILMDTDSVQRLFDFVRQGKVFDFRRLPSRRGWISEFFRRRPDVYRSVYPWHNVCGWGEKAEELIKDHEKCSPYAMGIHSPWYKLTQVAGKCLLLGVDFEKNSMIHCPLYLFKDKFQMPVFLDKPYNVKFINREEKLSVTSVVHAAYHPPEGATTAFCEYLDTKYSLFQHRNLAATRATVFDAASLVEAYRRELDSDVSFYNFF